MTTATGIKATGIDVCAYLVKDASRAVTFYKEMLGLTTSVEHEQGAEFELPDGTTFGVWRMRDGSWHPSAGVFFAVPDVKQATAVLRERGVKILEEPLETPVCFMAVVEDSEGNSFVLHQRKAQ
jgi:predicted enzyme related to lactoylglutathione lyase